MLRITKLIALVILVAGTLACGGRHSATGFRLPDDGDIGRGQLAFVEKGCSNCHEVYGVDLPRPTVQPPVPVVLGGEVAWKISDGYLTTSVINPSYRLARYPGQQITSNGRSRMPHYRDELTVGELTDIVAFLQSRYIEQPAMPAYVPY